jgi:hypothetical protein
MVCTQAGAETDSIDEQEPAMQPHTITTPAHQLPAQPLSNVLRVTSRQLTAIAPALVRAVIVPKADEEAWEGTEIDVRRTVL